MASTKILIATLPEDHRNTIISSSTNQLRTMLPAKSTAVTLASVNSVTSSNDGRPRPACLTYLDPKPNVGPRKRQRLNHLSPDEKLMRRKMKNRVAAQTARDRKKALMERLEDKIYEFELQQSRLVEENSTLRSRNQKLEAENKELRKRLGLDEMDTDSQCTDETFHVTVKEEAESPESAAGADSATFITVDNDIHMQSDVLLGILGEINGQGHPTEDGPESVDFDQEGGEEDALFAGNANPSAAAPSLVGAAAADMESIKELIRFDHVYYKRPAEKTPTIKEEMKQVKIINKSALPLGGEECLETPQDSLVDPDQSVDFGFLMSLNKVNGEDEVQLTNPFVTNKIAPMSNVVDQFDCDISQLLTNEDLDMCDSLSDSGKSTGSSSADSGVDSDDGPSSPHFTMDPLGSPVMPNCDWEESFIDLFPSLDM